MMATLPRWQATGGKANRFTDQQARAIIESMRDGNISDVSDLSDSEAEGEYLDDLPVQDFDEPEDGEDLDQPLNADENVEADPAVDADETLDADPSLEAGPTAETPSDDDTDTAASPRTRLTFQWKKKRFQPGPVDWVPHENQDELENGISVSTPLQYFMEYFDDNLFETMAEKTNIYAMLNNGFALNTTAKELRCLFGIHILMGSLGFPRCRMYWQPETKIELIADSMKLNRFFRLRNNLHATTDDDQQEGNLTWKVQPVLDNVQNKCVSLVPEENNSIDEQMIPFKGKSSMKQVVKGKPTPVGLKNFVRCGISGICYDFEIYQGKGTGIRDEDRHLGLGGSVVIRLVEAIPRDSHFKVCFDNYFTGLTLLKELKDTGICAVGTIRADRIQNCPLKSEKELKKQGRGASDSAVDSKGDVLVVRWMDNSVVQLASNYIGNTKEGPVRRWSAKEKTHIDVSRPEIVKVYNETMGGVDKLDMLISLYRIFIRSRKWTLRVIFHFVDLAVCNCWLTYRRDARAMGIPDKEVMDLLRFRTVLAEGLIKAEPARRKRGPGRPPLRDLNEAAADEPPVKAYCAPLPVPDVRFDQIEHYPSHLDGTPKRCRYEACDRRSRIICEKCNGIALCLTKDRNCFLRFHTE